MTIATGDTIPDVELRVLDKGNPVAVRSIDVLGKGRVVLFGVPGAFTPTCSDYHLPGFVDEAARIHAKGVDTIACISVNDAWVMNAWGKAQRVGDEILMLADGNADFARAAGLEADLGVAGLGVRCKRFAAVLQDGVVEHLLVETAPGLDVSSAASVISALG